MKKLIIIALICLLSICAFTVVASASEVAEVTNTYYLVQTLDSEVALALKAQGKENLIVYSDMLGSTSEKTDGETTQSTFFHQFAEGSHVEIIFVEDIFVPKTIVPSGTGILINTPITVTFRYNGFAHYIDSANNSTGNGIYLRHKDANLRLIGTKAIDGENGEISNKFTNPSGDIADGTFKTTNCNLDVFKYSFYYVRVQHGNVYVENVRSYSQKALVMTEDSATGTYEFVSCALNSNNVYSIELMGKSGKTMIIEGGLYNKVEIISPKTGTSIKNAIVSQILMDCYSLTGQIFEITNTELGKIGTATGRVIFNIVDCNFEENQLYIGADSAGSGVAYIITSPTCKTAGVKAKYIGNGNAYDNTTCSIDAVLASKTTEELPVIDHTATDDNDCTTDVLCSMCNEEIVYPKQFDAHKLITLSVKYANGFAKEGERVVKCENCEGANKLEATAPIFVAQGYTSNADGTGFGTGFQINKGALAEYEELNGAKITFGIVVFNPQYLNGEAFIDGEINATKGALQVNMTTEYTNCNLLVNGFNEAHAGLELVFAGYAYEGTDTSKLEIMQKEYISTDDAPILSPMCSQVNGLYTVKLSTVLSPSAVGNKESLDEFVKKTA